jgi:ABC-type branched-subunit amino acid transport system substrate-binding protein
MKLRRVLSLGLAIGVAAAFSTVPASGAAKKTTTKKTTTTKATATTAPPTTQAPAAPAPAPAAATGGGEFTVMVIGDFTSTIAFTVKEALAGVKASLKDVPKAKVVGCDSKGDPNAWQACARDAVSQKVSAVVQAFSLGSTDASILTKAGIPFLGQSDMIGASSFALVTGVAAYTGMGLGFIKSAGCVALGVLYLDGSDQLVDAINNGAKLAGGSVVVKAAIANNAPDVSPAIAKLIGAGVDCIALSVTPPQVPQAIIAISQTGVKVKVGGVDAIFPQAIIKALGRLSEGALVFSAQANADDVSTILKQIKADIAAIDSSAGLTQQAILSWAAGRLIGKALPNVKGQVTAESLLAGLNSVGNVDIDGILSLSLKGQKSPLFKRLMNTRSLMYIVKDGVPRRSGEFYDYAAALPGN